jgi:hypothetical protein
MPPHQFVHEVDRELFARFTGRLGLIKQLNPFLQFFGQLPVCFIRLFGRFGLVELFQASLKLFFTGNRCYFSLPRRLGDSAGWILPRISWASLASDWI